MPQAASAQAPAPNYSQSGWLPASTTITPQAAPAAAPRASNTATNSLLSLIALLLLAIALLQAVNTFKPRRAPGVQSVSVQRQVLKKETQDEVKDTIDKAQSALNALGQQSQQEFNGAANDAQRQAILLKYSYLYQQIMAQQLNDILLIMQDLNT